MQLFSASFIFFLALFGLMENFYHLVSLTIWTFENYMMLSNSKYHVIFSLLLDKDF